MIVQVRLYVNLCVCLKSNLSIADLKLSLVKKYLHTSFNKLAGCCFLFCALAGHLHGQEINENTPWIWMGGDNIVSQTGVYGTKGIPNINNKPAARSQAASWTDSTGTFWLFGGRSYGGTITEAVRNDLWKFSPNTKEWTWVGGDSTVNGLAVPGTPNVPSVNNIPSARSLINQWKDNDGCFWILGGVVDASGSRRNDLWKFNPYNQEWTLVRVPAALDTVGIYGVLGTPNAANRPGSRSAGSCWADNSGNLWLFGGQGYSSLPGTVVGLSDWWKYNIASNQWTWMGGPNTSAPAANYGLQGVASAANIPGGRYNPIQWKDTSGNFWMMGGMGYVTATQGMLNDLWKFNPLTNQWTWMQGTNMINDLGMYISRGTASAERRPRARRVSTTWVDMSGNLWMFGGTINSFQTNSLNDIWKYDIAINQWTWIKGDSIANILPVYNTLGIPNSTNEIGSRGVETSWREKKNNNVWIFGGHAAPYGTRNDLWKIQACSPLDTLQAIAGKDTGCAGATIVYTAPQLGGAFSYIWHVPPGWTGSSNTQQISVIAGNTGGVLSLRVLGTCGDTSNVQIKNIVIENLPLPVISQAGTGSAITLFVTTNYTTYQWFQNGNLIPGATSSTYTAVENGAYSVMVTSVHGCTYTSATEQVSGITGVHNLKAVSGISFYPNPAHDKLNVRCYVNVVLRISSIQGKVLQQNRMMSGQHVVDLSGLLPGIYFAEFRTPEGLFLSTYKIEKQ